MLYFFPNESARELKAKARQNLRKEIERARWVEKNGFRPREISLPSSYIYWRCINNYLKCPISKFKLPSSWKEKVDLEKMPSEFLDQCRMTPMIFQDPVTREKVQRVVGFREILRKREHVEFLKDLEVSDDEDEDGSETSRDSDELAKAEDGACMEDMAEMNCAEHVNSQDYAYKREQFLQLARGGGKNDKKKKKKKDGDKKDKKPKDKDKKKDKGKRGTKKAKDKKKGIFQQIIDYFKVDPNKLKAKAEQERKEKEKKEKEKKVKSTRWGINWLEKDLLKQQLEKEYQQNLEQIFKYHSLFRVPAAKEMDSEWLNLSDTDPEQEKDTIQNFGKEPLEWMKPDISFESQYLARTLRWYLWSLNIMGRSFLNVKPDYLKGHMDFRHTKRDVLLFFVTTIIHWMAFCLMVAAFMDIQWENQKQETNKRRGNERQQEVFQRVALSYHQVEELELDKYQIPILVTSVNLILVAFWSIMIILGDGILVSHYFNCWCAALAEMETSGCLGIKRLIIVQHVVWLSYTTIMSSLFYLNYPAHIRYTSGLITSMILRPVITTNLRVAPEKELLTYQLAGLAFQIYVQYCVAMVKLCMQILALILKNSSEMWNFKFALTFQQLAVKNKGQLYRLGLHHSLTKLFTHHRILTVLLRNFGEVFAVPILIYMTCEMAIITLTMVKLFFYKAGSITDYDGHESIIIRSAEGTEPPIKIPYYHTPPEDYLMYMLMMFQMALQYLSATERLAAAGNAFFAGYEFVRRSGTVLCHTSHQRRLIQSLEWSFSSTNPSILSANSYFALNRETILGSFAAVAGFFSLIIQLQVDTEKFSIQFLEESDCADFEGFKLRRGTCVHDFNNTDSSLFFYPVTNLTS